VTGSSFKGLTPYFTTSKPIVQRIDAALETIKEDHQKLRAQSLKVGKILAFSIVAHGRLKSKDLPLTNFVS
jgi:hypothetical protein